MGSGADFLILSRIRGKLTGLLLAALFLPSATLGATLDDVTDPETVFGSGGFTGGDTLSIGPGKSGGWGGLRTPLDLETQLLRRIEATPSDTDLLKNLALLYVRTGRLEAARTTLKEVHALEPGDTAVAIDIARLARTTDGTAAARAVLEGFKRDADDRFPYRLALIQLDYDTGALASARRGLERMLAEDLPQARAHSLRLLFARYLLAEDETEAARAQIETVLETTPQNPDALAFRAFFRLKNLDLDGAQSDIATGLAAEPANTSLLRLAARADWRAGQHALAVEHLLAAVSASDYQTDIVLDAVDVLEETAQREEALRQIGIAIKRHPAAAQLVARLGTLQLAAEDWDGAERAAASLRQFGTPQAVGDSEKIRLAVLRGRGQAEAAQSLLSQLAASGSDLGAIAEVVNTHLAQDERGAAMDYVAGLLEEAPENPALLLMNASLNEMAGNTDFAEAGYRAVVQKIPASPIAHIALAQHLMREGRPTEAEAAIRAGLAQRPEDPSLKMPLVEILLRRREIEPALQNMEALVRAYPDNALVANNYVALVTDYAVEDAARLELATSVAGQLKSSPIPQLRDTYGWLLHKRGDHQAAKAVLTAVLEEIPEDAWANYHLGMVQVSLGEDDDAIVHLRRALATTDASFDKTDVVVATLGSLEGQ
ncbi:tetratricopeptide repeat protein [uncultured Roseobacter sp.]|uniref:tetratricopeptide repeat protein n=1 Tax=uncultured Roseobacter sp. TaxID=114847 RepID=UPI002608696B|nr:tetratricopeptide repeat protein [uncultured Roseobacter sp.]